MQRIHRFQINRIDYSFKNIPYVITDTFKWTKGNKIITEVYNQSVFDGIRDDIKYNELLTMIQECRDGGNVIFDVNDNITIEVKHWSYRKK